MAWVSFIYGFSGTVQSGPSLQLVSKVISNLSLKAALVALGHTLEDREVRRQHLLDLSISVAMTSWTSFR